jgi:hypothetical protein
MKRVVVKFKDKELDHTNIEGDCIYYNEDFIYIYKGDNIVGMVRPDLVNLICISEKQDRQSNNEVQKRKS